MCFKYIRFNFHLREEGAEFTKIVEHAKLWLHLVQLPQQCAEAFHLVTGLPLALGGQGPARGDERPRGAAVTARNVRRPPSPLRPFPGGAGAETQGSDSGERRGRGVARVQQGSRRPAIAPASASTPLRSLGRPPGPPGRWPPPATKPADPRHDLCLSAARAED